ncbi:MAG: hypothetical protein FJY81_03700, partial [Candidatus Aminicenantes bacterium]|nr:hypothetical protein [Candidatus Aminicenantes bacterium]
MNVWSRERGFSSVGLVLALAGFIALVVGGALALYFTKGKAITIQDIASGEKIINLPFTQKERKLMLENLKDNASDYAKLRAVDLANSVPPALQFSPVVPDMTFDDAGKKEQTFILPEDSAIERPA